MTAYIFKQRAIVGSTLRVDQVSALGDFLKSFSSLNGEDFLSFDPQTLGHLRTQSTFIFKNQPAVFFFRLKLTLK